MSTDLTLMGMPQEIILLILTLFFSTNPVKTSSLLRRSARNKPAGAKQQIPTCLAVLLVNKALYQIGWQCFHEFTTVWSDTIFKREWDPALSWVYYQVPWNRIRYVSGSFDLADNMNLALEAGLLRINHLREICISYRLVVFNP